MALTLTKETGAGLSNANSYASAADGDAYHDGHLYASAWTGATTATKEAALVMATRLIDASYRFHGLKSSSTQALQWPRKNNLDPDTGKNHADDAVATNVVDATCEIARELIKEDPTDDPEGEGLRRLKMGGGVDMTFDKKDRKPMIPHAAQRMLHKLGSLIRGQSTMARLVRA